MKQGLRLTVGGVIFLISILMYYSCSNSSFSGEKGVSAPEKDAAAGKAETAVVDNIKVEPKTTTIAVGEKATFKAYIDGKDLTDKLSWSSSDSSVATTKKAGVFTGVDIGEIEVEVRSDEGDRGKATLLVERSEELDNAIKYTKIVYGIENCIDGPEPDVGDCLGDCNDAWLVIDGDLSLGTSKDKVYITSNKKQSVTVTTYYGTWNYPPEQGGNEAEIDADLSFLRVTVRDRSNHVLKKASLKLRNKTKNYPLDTAMFYKEEPVEIRSLSVEKGYAIDLETYFAGTSVGAGKSCPVSVSKLTRNKNVKAGYLLRENCSAEAIRRGHCSLRAQ